MNVLLVASILLILRIISVGLLTFVVRRQWRLFRTHAPSEVRHVRAILFGLGVGGLFGQIIPIIIDLIAIRDYEPGMEVHGILVFYAVSNAVSSVVASFLLWYMYYLIEKQNVKLGEDDKKK